MSIVFPKDLNDNLFDSLYFIARRAYNVQCIATMACALIGMDLYPLLKQRISFHENGFIY